MTLLQLRLVADVTPGGVASGADDLVTSVPANVGGLAAVTSFEIRFRVVGVLGAVGGGLLPRDDALLLLRRSIFKCVRSELLLAIEVADWPVDSFV